MDVKTAKLSVETCDGDKGEFVTYKDITLPTNFLDQGKLNLVNHMYDVMNFEIHESDVFLATYAKSGTHWAWEVISMLHQGTADYIKVDKETTFIDLVSPKKIAKIPSPKVINSHFPARLLPRQVLEKGVKIVHVQRNVKDVMVSLYHHLKTEKMPFTKDFDTFFNFFLGDFGVHIYCSWAYYVKEWESFTKQHPDQILNVYFENMKEDPVREIQKIDQFLLCNRGLELIKDIADACSFHKLKKADTEKEHEFETPADYIYRKGEVGDWKNWFTVAQNEKMDKWLMENLKDTNLAFRYTL